MPQYPSRFRQDLLDGMYTCRAMSLFSDDTLKKGDRGYYNGSPFAEATRLVYDYNADWQVSALTNGIQYDSNGNGKIDEKDADITYPVYLEKDVEYSVRFEVTLGKMGSVILTVQEVLESINNDYLDIIKLTGITPDAYRDYGFNQVLHDTVEDFVIQSKKLIDPEVLEKGDSAVKPGNTDVYSQLISMAGVKSSNAATIEKVGRLLDEMGHDEDEIAKNLETLKTYIGTLGTFLSDAQTQPLQLDYIVIQPAGAEQPAAMPNFWESLVHEVKGFFQSFVRDYDSMSAGDVGDGAVVGKTEVWFASARDQSQVLRSLVSNEFTPVSKIAVELKLVAGGTLLPSILAGAGPDANLGMGAGDVINYAIRDAINNIEDMYDFDEYVENNFNEAAMIQLGIEDADNNMHYYGLPEAQGFSMMFVRTDILAGLDLEVPKTWDDIMACIPTLQANNMQIGLPTDYKIFMYQQNGELFADKGMRINLDSKIALESFEEMCNLFTMYSFPYKYDAANRFRTGEMPILLGDYTGTYNQLKVFATELEGKWEFIPLPGKLQEDGTINNVSISTVAATVMIKIDEEKLLKKGVTAEEIENTKFCAWEFMKWFTGAECQVGFSNEMVAILGHSAKQATANKNALANMPWTTAELAEVQSQFNNLAAIPNYPGSYIIDRYTNFAFLDAYNTYADPSSSLVQYIHTINKEIERKREEFDLETLSDGDKDYSTLVEKRTAQLEYLKGKISGHDALMEQVLNAVYSGKKSEILNAQADVQATLDAKYTNHADTYRTDLIKVMGYDMTDTTISKRTKEKARHCFYYEVYRETESTVTQLYFVSEYLGDIATLLNQ